MRQPTLDIVTQGVGVLLKWCSDRTAQIIMGRHRNVVEKTLDLMLLVTEKKLVQPEVFEPYVLYVLSASCLAHRA